MLEDDIEVIGDKGLDPVEEELEASGREVLKELRRRDGEGWINQD